MLCPYRHTRWQRIHLKVDRLLLLPVNQHLVISVPCSDRPDSFLFVAALVPVIQ